VVPDSRRNWRVVSPEGSPTLACYLAQHVTCPFTHWVAVALFHNGGTVPPISWLCGKVRILSPVAVLQLFSLVIVLPTTNFATFHNLTTSRRGNEHDASRYISTLPSHYSYPIYCSPYLSLNNIDIIVQLCRNFSDTTLAKRVTAPTLSVGQQLSTYAN